MKEVYISADTAYYRCMQRISDNNTFSFRTNARIVCGPGSIAQLPDLIQQFLPDPPGRLLVIRGGESFCHSQQWRELIAELNNRNIQMYEQEVRCEPSVELIDGAVEDYRSSKIAAVAAIGGGSVIDAGKAIAAMLTVTGSVQEYLEGVGSAPHPGSSLPCIAVPTTAGTGSEATKNAVISRIGHNGFKKSLRHDHFVPSAAVLDGELGLSCPAHITAACGMDALTQLIESYTSTQANVVTDALALRGISLAGWALPRLCDGGASDVDTRQAMLSAAYLSGVCLANAGLGIVHGLAGVIGGFFDMPHGMICGSLLAPAVRANIHAMQQHADQYAEGLGRYAEVGRILIGEQLADSDVHNALITYLEQLSSALRIPLLSSGGVAVSDIGRILDNAGLKNNPVQLDRPSLQHLLSSRLSK